MIDHPQLGTVLSTACNPTDTQIDQSDLLQVAYKFISHLAVCCACHKGKCMLVIPVFDHSHDMNNKKAITQP